MTPIGSVISDFIRVLENLGIPYLIGGSFASSAWGLPRQTLDLDVAIFLSQATAEALYEAVKNDYMTSKSDIDESLQSTEEFRGFQLIHFEETFKIDVFVMSPDEYSIGVFPRALRYPIFDGHLANYASPEDIVLVKLR